MKYYKHTTTNELFAYELDGSQDHLISDELIQISDNEANQIRVQNEQQILDSLAYDKRRAIEYPSISTQLDMLYHDIKNGTLESGAWIQAIEQVKTTFPKE
jgi:hypothetical protein